MFTKTYILYIFMLNIRINSCEVQIGPDPWDYVSNVSPTQTEHDLPPDLTIIPQRKLQTSNVRTGDWFYRRMLAIVLKGGQVKKNEDGSIDVSLQMKYDHSHWSTLEGYIKSSGAFSEDMYRRSLGYIEEAIYKPTISEKIILAWNEYIQHHLTAYKVQITWGTSILAGVMAIYWLWNKISHKHIIIILFICLYLYEVFISYKEAERNELDRFIAAVNKCKWYIWTSECDVPPPDLVTFLKHMNPLKIAIRMFTTILSEPIITISETINLIVHGITDGLWFPFNTLIYVVLIFIFNATLILLLIIIIFNYILNIPFKFNLLGIVSVGLIQRNQYIPSTTNDVPSNVPRADNGDRISGENLSKLLDVYAHALNSVKAPQIMENRQHNTKLSLTYKPKMPRSASTGRLPNYEYCSSPLIENNNITKKFVHKGGGDAH